VLVLHAPPDSSFTVPTLQQGRGRWFVEGADEIALYLARVHGIGLPH
jgi:hypothetical protein